MTDTQRTPRQRIEAACALHGGDAVVRTCMDLLAGRDADPRAVELLGGTHSEAWLGDPTNAYWLRVWGARGLLWMYAEQAEGARLTVRRRGRRSRRPRPAGRCRSCRCRP